MLRALATAAVLLVATSADAELSARQTRTFELICAHCHMQPGIGAPLLGDAAAWSTRRSKGFEVMVRNSVDGVGGMPPLGTCSYCSEADLRALIAWLADMPLPDAPASRRDPP